MLTVHVPRLKKMPNVDELISLNVANVAKVAKCLNIPCVKAKKDAQSGRINKPECSQSSQMS